MQHRLQASTVAVPQAFRSFSDACMHTNTMPQSHDGISGNGYYSGHNNWAPIMGVSPERGWRLPKPATLTPVLLSLCPALPPHCLPRGTAAALKVWPCQT